ncbi:hypothetical protein O181_058397 [Austropuccinia psidii MF-1]|uniref:B30.2/SPRY domain-containing protein n=1 Tax=Austropuccinia psidii MF-1 TaxID=1389203 RepID=A0A9Q3HWD9_9BASI|nr:hypothetical protein [Austropuccinia psidii MF-1]
MEKSPVLRSGRSSDGPKMAGIPTHFRRIFHSTVLCFLGDYRSSASFAMSIKAEILKNSSPDSQKTPLHGDIEIESAGEEEAGQDIDDVQTQTPLVAIPEALELSPEDRESQNGLPTQSIIDASSAELGCSIGLLVPDERDEQSASEREETDRENSVQAENRSKARRKIDGSTGTDTDLKSSSPTLHVDSTTTAISPAFQSLPSYFPPDFFATRSHPWNRSGFRYLACGPAPNQQGDVNDYPIYYTIETLPPCVAKWSWEDRSSYVHITKDGLSVTTDRGFRSARANLPIREGVWYFEIIMIRAGGELNPGGRSDPEEAHVRVGVARRESGLNGPVGIDGYSYGIRDKTGEKVHLSRLQPYSEQFGTGDVIGVLLALPKMRQADDGDKNDPARIQRKRVPIRYRRQLYFESPEYPISKEMEELAQWAVPSKLKQELPSNTASTPISKKKSLPGQKHSESKSTPTLAAPTAPPLRQLPVLKGSKLIFFKNGVCQGVAFEDLLDFLPLRLDSSSSQKTTSEEFGQDLGATQRSGDNLHDDGTLGYYPCVSVYGGGIARLNAGPQFRFPPHDIDGSLLVDQVGSTKDVQAFQKDDEQPSSNLPWRPLSELYPIYMAEQRRLDELDGMEIRKQAMQQAEQANKSTNAAKRKRLSSPNITSISSSTGKGKKKGKSGLMNESLQTASFRPSPLGNMELFEGETSPSVPLRDDHGMSNDTSSLSILCQVASESIAVLTPEPQQEQQVVDTSESINTAIPEQGSTISASLMMKSEVISTTATTVENQMKGTQNLTANDLV